MPNLSQKWEKIRGQKIVAYTYSLTPNVYTYIYFSPLLLLFHSFSFVFFFFCIYGETSIVSWALLKKTKELIHSQLILFRIKDTLFSSFTTFPGNYLRRNDPLSSPLCRVHSIEFPLNQMQKLTPVVPNMKPTGSPVK